MPDTPTYLAIADTIRGHIARGEEGWRPGDQIPGEDALADLPRCAPGTARHAVDRLRKEGLVRSGRRRTYVRYIPPVRTLRDDRFREAVREAGGARGAYDREMTDLGLKGHTRWLRPPGPGPCPDDDAIGRGQETSAALLGVPAGETVMIRARHMLATPVRPDGTPDGRNEETLQLATSYIPWDLAVQHPGLIGEDSGVGGIYSRLRDVGHQVARAREYSSARVGTDMECELLGLEPASIVQWVDRQAFDASGRVVEICRHVVPPGHFVTVHEFGIDP
jgi:GntR family transcriptional regulator